MAGRSGRSFVMLDRDGSVLVTTGSGSCIGCEAKARSSSRRQSGTAMRIARELIDKKLAGQEQVARHKLLAVENADAIHRYRSELAEAETPDSVRLIESQAASAYWAAWRTLPIRFPRKDECRVPEHWRVFGARISPLTGSPVLRLTLQRNPELPLCCLESESRLGRCCPRTRSRDRRAPRGHTVSGQPGLRSNGAGSPTG